LKAIDKLNEIRTDFFKLMDEHIELYQINTKLEKNEEFSNLADSTSRRIFLQIIQNNTRMTELRDHAREKLAYMVGHLKKTKVDIEALKLENQKSIKLLDKDIEFWENNLNKFGEHEGDYVFEMSEFDAEGNIKSDFE
jgi:hypothetical protein